MKAEMKVKRNTYSEFIEFELQDAVGTNVKHCIADSGFTVDEICIRTNLSVATINRLKAGKNLSFHSICALAEELNKEWRVLFK